MNQTKLIEGLKNNERAYCYLSGEEKAFLTNQKQGDVVRVIARGKFMVMDKDEVGINPLAIYCLYPDFEPPYGGLFIPKGCNLLDPKKCKVGEKCAVDDKFGNPPAIEKCEEAECYGCIAYGKNQAHLERCIADQGGQRKSETKKKSGYEEFDVKVKDGRYYMVNGAENLCGYLPHASIRLDKVMSMVGFSGIKFRFQDGSVSSYINSLCLSEDKAPTTPVSVRIWIYQEEL